MRTCRRPLYHRLRRRAPEPLQQLALERARVHADADRDAPLARRVDYRTYALRLTDVAGVEAQLRHARLGSFESQLVVEVYVGDERHRRVLDQLGKIVRRHLVGHGGADDLDAGVGEPLDLGDRDHQVDRAGERHRLDGNRCAAADRHVPDHYAAGALAVRSVWVYGALHRLVSLYSARR